VQKFLLRQALAKRIHEESIEALVPSKVRFKHKQETMEEIVDKLVVTGKFDEGQKAELEEFLLSLDEEQDDQFKKLILRKE